MLPGIGRLNNGFSVKKGTSALFCVDSDCLAAAEEDSWVEGKNDAGVVVSFLSYLGILFFHLKILFQVQLCFLHYRGCIRPKVFQVL